MPEHVDTIVVGGGQGGLATSYHLQRRGLPHVVLERSDRPAEAWRNHRWDSFVLNTPNWQTRLPGAEYDGDDPDGFMACRDVVAYFERYVERFGLPVRYRTGVASVKPGADGFRYVVTTDDGTEMTAANVVVATGLYQTPSVPASSAAAPSGVLQLHSDAYHNPDQLPSGAVLVVGSAQSGCQIAEELYQRGRKVYLAVGRSGRIPRRYRGKDSNRWSELLGVYERTVDELPSPKAKFLAKPAISGTAGGHTLSLHVFARDGVGLLGHLEGFRDGTALLAPDLHENLTHVDAFEAEFVRDVDAYVARSGIAAPSEVLPALRDGFAAKIVTELDLRSAGITTILWATSYAFDFRLVALPILDADGYPVQHRGVTNYHGLYFVGLPWLHDAKSGLIYGVGGDAEYVAARIEADEQPVLVVPRAAAADVRWLSHDLCCA